MAFIGVGVAVVVRVSGGEPIQFSGPGTDLKVSHDTPLDRALNQPASGASRSSVGTIFAPAGPSLDRSNNRGQPQRKDSDWLFPQGKEDPAKTLERMLGVRSYEWGDFTGPGSESVSSSGATSNPLTPSRDSETTRSNESSASVFRAENSHKASEHSPGDLPTLGGPIGAVTPQVMPPSLNPVLAPAALNTDLVSKLQGAGNSVPRTFQSLSNTRPFDQSGLGDFFSRAREERFEEFQQMLGAPAVPNDALRVNDSIGSISEASRQVSSAATQLSPSPALDRQNLLTPGGPTKDFGKFPSVPSSFEPLNSKMMGFTTLPTPSLTPSEELKPTRVFPNFDIPRRRF